MAKTHQIQYTMPDGSKWTGTLQNVECTRVFGSRLSTSDPKWIHKPEGSGRRSYSDDKLCFVSLKGATWWTRVRAHTERRADHATFDFLIWPDDDSNPIGQYVDLSIVFRTWDGTFQRIARIYEEDGEVFLDVEPYAG